MSAQTRHQWPQLRQIMKFDYIDRVTTTTMTTTERIDIDETSENTEIPSPTRNCAFRNCNFDLKSKKQMKRKKNFQLRSLCMGRSVHNYTHKSVIESNRPVQLAALN